jgi:hypothetical protein
MSPLRPREAQPTKHEEFPCLQVALKRQPTTDNDLKFKKFTFFFSSRPNEERRKINKKAIVFNRNLCFPSLRFIMAGDFYVVNKFSFSIVRSFRELAFHEILKVSSAQSAELPL